MRVYFLRHGLAGDAAKWSGPDFDRPLTDAGSEKMVLEGKAIDELDLRLEAIITSPLVRAKQTAAIVAKALKMRDRFVEDERLGLEFDLARFSSILHENENLSALMLVGHEPSMSDTIGHLIGGGRIDFKKGSLACVDVPHPAIPSGDLLFLVPSRVLVKVAHH